MPGLSNLHPPTTAGCARAGREYASRKSHPLGHMPSGAEEGRRKKKKRKSRETWRGRKNDDDDDDNVEERLMRNPFCGVAIRFGDRSQQYEPSIIACVQTGRKGEKAGEGKEKLPPISRLGRFIA